MSNIEWHFNGNPPEPQFPTPYLVTGGTATASFVSKWWYDGEGKWSTDTSLVNSKPCAWAEWPTAPPLPTPQEVVERWVEKYCVGTMLRTDLYRSIVGAGGLLEQLGVIE